MDQRRGTGHLAARGLAIGAVVIPLTTMVSHSFNRTTYPLLLPAIKDDLALSNTGAGIGGTVIFIAYLVGVVVVTMLASKLAPISVMRGGLAVSVIGLVLISIGPSLGYLILGLTVANVATAGIWITAPVLATRDVAPHRRGVVIGMLTGSMGLASSLIALGTKASRSATGNQELWRPIFAVEAVVALIVLLLVLTTMRSTSAARQPGRSISLAALRSMPGWLPLTIAYSAFGAIASGYGAFLAESLETDGNISRQGVSTIYLALGFSSLIGSTAMGWLSDRTGRRLAMIAVLLMSVTASTAVALLHGPPLIILVVVFGGAWSAFPSLTATYVRDHLDDQAFGSAFGTMTIFYGIAAIAPPFVAGVVADARGSFTVPYLSLAALSLAAAAVLTQTPPRTTPPRTTPRTAPTDRTGRP